MFYPLVIQITLNITRSKQSYKVCQTVKTHPYLSCHHSICSCKEFDGLLPYDKNNTKSANTRVWKEDKHTPVWTKLLFDVNA